jgi:hypothetical protein
LARFALPLAGEDWKNMGLEASWEARALRGVSLWEAFSAADEGPAAGLGELRRLRLGVADCGFRWDRLGAGEDMVGDVFVVLFRGWEDRVEDTTREWNKGNTVYEGRAQINVFTKRRLMKGDAPGGIGAKSASPSRKLVFFGGPCALN